MGRGLVPAELGLTTRSVDLAAGDDQLQSGALAAVGLLAEAVDQQVCAGCLSQSSVRPESCEPRPNLLTERMSTRPLRVPSLTLLPVARAILHEQVHLVKEFCVGRHEPILIDLSVTCKR